jgi:hypothetical protein
MNTPKRKSPHGADPKLSAKWQIDAAKQQANADAYYRRWLEAFAADPDPPASAEELENHEFVLALIRCGSVEFDPETDTLPGLALLAQTLNAGRGSPGPL